jgi:energy-coupling factor transporter ATP-binding protein EcfA2
VKLSSLQIERFGARSNLQLEHLSDHLNVVYGPNGSGKTTIIHFIRWVLFGGQDELSRRYLTSGQPRVGGLLRVVDGHQRHRVVSRFFDNTYGDQVKVTSEERDLVTGLEQHRLTGVDLNEYRLVFCFGFDQPPAVEQLVDIAVARDFALTYDQQQMQRMRELTDRLEQLRRAHGSLMHDESLPGLLERRRQLQAELDHVERQRADRLRRIQAECDELAAEIAQDRRQIDELEVILRRTDANIDSRRQQLEMVAHEANQTRDRWMDERRAEVADIDYQIQQWHHVLDTIRQRHERLQASLAPTEPQSVLSFGTSEVELRSFLRSLGFQIDDVEQDLRDMELVEGGYDERTRTDYLRSILGAALRTMRDDVQRLCRELQRTQANAKYWDHAREQDHLRRCETELSSLIESLTKRRQSLAGEPELADLNWAKPISANGYAHDYNGHPVLRPWYDTSLETSYETTGWNETYRGHETLREPLAPLAYTEPRTYNDPLLYHEHRTASTRYVLTDPVLEARLAHLTKRRHHIHARMRELENEMMLSEQRLDLLRNGREHLEEDRKLETLRRELESVELRIRQVEERQRRREEIEALERQIEELRRTLGPSEILREAAAILHRLTAGAYRGLRISDRREVWVEDDRGQRLAYGELSRGTRDQAYLAIALSLVAAYRRRGVELPLILNDVFINIDTDRAQATAEVLAQFSAQGHQVILFTRHEHILQRFTHLPAKLYTLRERHKVAETPRPLPVREPVVRHEGYYLDHAPVPSARAPWQAVAPVPEPRVRQPEPIEPPVQHEPAYDWVAQWDPPRRPVRPTLDPPTMPEMPLENGLGAVGEATPLMEIEWFQQPHAARLRELGIVTVHQLLELDPGEAQRHLSPFGIPATIVFRWQSQLALQCYVGLSSADAGLLVACGVDDPEELSYIDVSELHARIERFLASGDYRSRYGSIARFERSRLSRWIQSARRSHFRRHHQRWDRYRNGNGSGHGNGGSGNGGSGRRPVRAEMAEPTERLAARPRRVDARPLARTGDVLAEQVEPRTRIGEGRSETLRFFLEPTDPIVDAPSIGPKTAERFHAVGITTVAELLELDPEDAAARINYRRITPELIQSWQLQTSLVCRVPNLRGHDAQILVACNVPKAEQLAKMDPEALVGQVKQYVRTAEGKRVLRSAKAPDLSEVSAWIRWAKSARELVLRT